MFPKSQPPPNTHRANGCWIKSPKTLENLINRTTWMPGGRASAYVPESVLLNRFQSPHPRPTPLHANAALLPYDRKRVRFPQHPMSNARATSRKHKCKRKVRCAWTFYSMCADTMLQNSANSCKAQNLNNCALACWSQLALAC